MTSSGPATSGGAARRRAGAAGGAGGRGAGAGRRKRPACAASPTLRPSSVVKRSSELAQRGLGDELEGALGQRVDGVGALGGGERGHHDDRHGLGLAVAQRPQHAEAVQPGHVEVERERVGPVLAAQHERLVAVGGGADDGEALPRERVGEQPPHQARVVGDDDAACAGRAGLGRAIGA